MSFFQRYPRVLIGGDFNARHFDWGNPSCNQRGKRLSEYIAKTNIILTHSNTFSFHIPNKRPSNLDIFLSQELKRDFDCYTIKELSSLHFPVFYDVFSQLHKIPCFNYITDRKKFSSLTVSWTLSMDLVSRDDINACIDRLISFLSKTFKAASNKVIRSSSASSHLSPEEQAHIHHLIQLRNRFRRKFQRMGCSRFKFLRNVLNNTIHNDLT